MTQKGNLLIQDKLIVISEPPMYQIMLPVFNKIITQMIQNEKAYTASDTSVKGAVMGGYWFITNIEKRDKI